MTAVPLFSQPQAPAASSASQTPGQTANQTLPTLPAASTEPDYPDPRTFVIGIYGLWSPKSSGPDIRGGQAAAQLNTYESLYGIGQPYRITPHFEVGVPVTRTGMLYFDFERFHGSATQTLNRDSFIDTFSFNNGDSISSTYHIITGRIYLDDLMYPHKFPVARLRFHSIWGLRYLSLTQTVDSSTQDATAGLPGTSFQLGTNYIFFPEFGAAMEYAIKPHVLFRVDGAGFGFPHHSEIAETSAELSFRRKNLEILMGAKTLHFKTAPHKDEYEQGTFITPFVGIRWHF
jgi:hypothetical protein